MAQVTYIGPHDGVEVVLDSGATLPATRGAVVEVPDELAARLLEQPTNWKAAPKPRTPATDKE